MALVCKWWDIALQMHGSKGIDFTLHSVLNILEHKKQYTWPAGKSRADWIATWKPLWAEGGFPVPGRFARVQNFHSELQ